jgi:hypothetical protein
MISKLNFENLLNLTVVIHTAYSSRMINKKMCELYLTKYFLENDKVLFSLLLNQNSYSFHFIFIVYLHKVSVLTGKIVLPVLLRIMDSDYPFDIFKPFLYQHLNSRILNTERYNQKWTEKLAT